MDKETKEYLDRKFLGLVTRDDVEKLRQETKANFRQLKEESKAQSLSALDQSSQITESSLQQIRAETKADLDQLRREWTTGIDPLRQEIRELKKLKGDPVSPRTVEPSHRIVSSANQRGSEDYLWSSETGGELHPSIDERGGGKELGF